MFEYFQKFDYHLAGIIGNRRATINHFINETFFLFCYMGYLNGPGSIKDVFLGGILGNFSIQEVHMVRRCYSRFSFRRFRSMISDLDVILNTLNFRRYYETFSVVICAHTKTQGLYIGNGDDLALDVIPVLHHRWCGYFL